jgi:hypothetical protein
VGRRGLACEMFNSTPIGRRTCRLASVPASSVHLLAAEADVKPVGTSRRCGRQGRLRRGDRAARGPLAYAPRGQSLLAWAVRPLSGPALPSRHAQMLEGVQHLTTDSHRHLACELCGLPWRPSICPSRCQMPIQRGRAKCATARITEIMGCSCMRSFSRSKWPSAPPWTQIKGALIPQPERATCAEASRNTPHCVRH